MIIKYGVAVIRDNKILLLRKKGLSELILPGGKPEKNESVVDCITREIKEELNANVLSLKYLSTFEDVAAGKNEELQIKLHLGEISDFTPSSEIEGFVWYSINSTSPLSPILKNKIIPYLEEKGLI